MVSRTDEGSDKPNDKQQQLEKELTELAVRGIVDTFGTNKKKPLELPCLFSIAGKKFGNLWWSGDIKQRVEAIRQLMSEAISMLPADLIQKNPDVSWGYAASILYALQDLSPSEWLAVDEVTGGEYSKRIAHLKKLTRSEGDSAAKKKAFDRFIPEPLREKLALRLRVIEELWDNLRQSDETLFEPGYVPRPILHDEIKTAIYQGNKVLLLHGDAGTGKSRLARAIATLVRQSSDDIESLVVDGGGTDDDLEDSLSDFLTRYTPKAKAGTSARLQIRLRELLEDESAPPVVILDNIQDAKTLSSLLPKNPWRLVLVTSRRIFDSDKIDADILVGNMEDSEAYRLISRRVPGVSEDEIRKLATALGHRPMAIDHGCACLPWAPFYGSVEEFCNTLPISLERFDRDDELTLKAIYNITLRQLADHESGTSLLQLVDLILTFGPRFNDYHEFMPLVYPPSRGSVHGLDVDRADSIRFFTATDILTKRSLIRPDEREVMHELTADILRTIREDSIKETIHISVRLLDDRLNLFGWPGGSPVPHWWPYLGLQLSHLRSRILRLYGIDTPDRESEGDVVDHLTAISIRQFRERGILSQNVSGDTFYQLAVGRDRPNPEVTSLSREATELGYIPDRAEEDWLQHEQSSNSPVGPHMLWFKGTLASVFHPLTRYMPLDADTSLRSPHFALLSKVEVLDWRYEYHMRMFMAVVNIHLGRWLLAREWLDRCLGLCVQVSEDYPEADILRLACAQRFMELGLYSGDKDIREKYWNYGSSIFDEYMRPTRRASQFDDLLGSRFRQTFLTGFLNDSLKWQSEYGHSDLSEFFEMELGAHKAEYLRQELKMPALECVFEELRINLWTPGAIGRIVHDLDYFTQELGTEKFGYPVGQAIFDLSGCKLLLASNNRDVMTRLPETIARDAALFESWGCSYWHADALVAQYAAELRADRSQERIDLARAAAIAALASIGREDKLTVAELVAEHPSQVPRLLVY
ncbi:ATP-binding protein [Nocardia asiatica]|uniref:ATP-binding protein n=1 Tax=Nocardia asiatica TaxID=209252 RepID=UPI003EE0E08F